jgi:DNA-binding NarL/FixJ family response regulator
MDWSKARILLVHGDVQMRRWAHEVLHKQKVASVQSTRSPATGLDLLKRFAADVAVVQLHHPELTAADFVRRVRDATRSANPRLPVVAIVDAPRDDLLRDAEAAGIAGVIPRKASAEIFLERIAAAIEAPQRPATPAASTAAPRKTGRSPAPQKIETAAPAAERQAPVALVDAPAPPAARHNADDWAAAVAAEPVAAEPPRPDIAPAINEHAAWLLSHGGQGKRATLEKADLHGQSLYKANLASAGLREIDLSDADCRYAIFTSADLRRADLSGADLTGANLSVANLRGATLRLTKLSEASLRGADLAGACLTDAALAATDFAGANLLDTDLRRSDLTWAVGLTQTQIDKARADGSTRMPFGIQPPEFDE